MSIRYGLPFLAGVSVITSVLVCFAVCMVLAALWLFALGRCGLAEPPARPRMIGACCAGAAAVFLASELFVARAHDAGATSSNASERYGGFTGLMLLPAQYGGLYVLYPVFPWVGITLLGCAWGTWLMDHADRFLQFTAAAAVGCLSFFALLRCLGGFGNFSFSFLPAHPSAVQFFDVVKYPPSLCYTLLTLGLDFGAITLCQVLDRRYRRWRDDAAAAALEQDGQGEAKGEAPCAPFSWGFWHPFLMLGRSPLFFYLLHIWMLALCGIAIGGRDGADFYVSYPVWLCVVAVLVPLCERYGRFKQAKPVTSIWRLF